MGSPSFPWRTISPAPAILFINPYKEKYPSPQNLREWLLARFGAGICERYLFPYNEKVWNIPVEDLSMLWADRIPNPAPEDILKSAMGIPTEGYLHQLYYHYPRTGGYQELSNQWSKGVDVKYNFKVASVVKKEGLFMSAMARTPAVIAR